ncbi:specific transcription factor domain protein [Aspergillus parasiticus SU-1]|uniref:Specific transcription factor domain protein n=1 Tax=Aspergillus parasiticus (strain ATCC 56775 / NRRL 5862 / SRRC 143 / SU-1) TaxID=1403190 RepID=A0A0F0INC3_ASPPU|nr:specific transcription factor domain protein [Aspergillus parasiticus SU-1]
MRIGRGCERCRTHHIRCIIRTGASSCISCFNKGRSCRLDPRFHFKAVRCVYQKSNGSASKFKLEWNSRQTWVKVPKDRTCLTFIQETKTSTDGERSDTESQLHEEAKPSPDNLARSPTEVFPTLAQLASPDPTESCDEGNRFSQYLHRSGASANASVAVPSHFSPTDLLSRSVNEIPRTPLMNPRAGVTPHAIQPTSGSTTMLQISPYQAALLRLFIQRIAPSADVCDLGSHFATEVPRRAVQAPMVLKAVLALSARLNAILSNTSDWEASEYHGQCLELLIAALAQPEDTYDENLLITVVILRLYEELEQSSDEQCHLFGSNRLLNKMSTAASSGGIAEAISWVFLRQAIYASIVQCQPMQLDLANYERSTVFERQDDAAYANIAIFLCAKIIQLYPKSLDCRVNEWDWQQLVDSVEHWYQSRPVSWQPLQYKEADLSAARPFPESWIMSPSAGLDSSLQYSEHGIDTG